MMIKPFNKLLSLLLSFSLLLILTACGGGGGGGDDEEIDPVPVVKTAKVTIGIQRIDAAPGNNVGSVDLKITLPATFVLPAAANNPTTMIALVAGLDLQQVSYVHPTLHLTLLKATPFSTGNLITFTRTRQSGETLPAVASFQPDLIEVSEISETGDVTIQTGDYEITLQIEEI